MAGHASANVKTRIKLQEYIDTGSEDDALELMNETRESFLNGITEFAQVLVNYRR